MNESNVFGSGDAYLLTPSTSPVQSIKVATLKEIEVQFSSEVIKHHGKAKWPLAVADGKGSISGKAAMATFQMNLVNAILGGTLGTGYNPIQVDTAAIPGNPYQLTLTGAGATTVDLGAKIDGVNATRVASGPTTGQYSVASGVFTFASADTGKTAEISGYTPVVGSGQSSLGGNPAMGVGAAFKLVLAEVEAVSGKKITLELFAVKFLNLTVKFATEDFTIPDLAFEGMSDTSGNTYKWSAAP